MMFAGAAQASCALASQTALSTATVDAEAERAIDVVLNGVSSREALRDYSLEGDDTLGEQVSCQFTLVNPATTPAVGDIVRVLFYSHVLFAGTIDRLTRTVNRTLTVRTFDCTCVDWSQILVRHKIQRNFTRVPLAVIADSLLDNELSGEGLSIGTIDRGTTIPLVDSRGGSAWDVLRDAAGVIGQTLYVDAAKRLHCRATTNEAAPLQLLNGAIEDASVTIDRETYRNVQTVLVTGTPATGAGALTTTQLRTNDDQIAERAAIEGGTGRYEDIEKITHPTSNDGVEISLLGIGYANLRLATSGVPRQTLTCRVRGYGFRAGQFALVDLPDIGATGTWLIQRVSFKEEIGRRLVHELELTQSSLQERAYESWLRIVSAGKVTVQMPSALTNNLATFNTPGATTWTVPDGVTTAQFTATGASAGAGGYWRITNFHASLSVVDWTCDRIANGGRGGNSGKAVTVRAVVPGEVYDLVIGAKGNKATVPAGSSLFGVGGPCPSSANTDGSAGGLSSVKIGAVTVVQGDGGKAGKKATGDVQTGTPGANGSAGSGIGDAVSVGGGKTGGINFPVSDGVDGEISIAW